MIELPDVSTGIGVRDTAKCASASTATKKLHNQCTPCTQLGAFKCVHCWRRVPSRIRDWVDIDLLREAERGGALGAHDPDDGVHAKAANDEVSQALPKEQTNIISRVKSHARTGIAADTCNGRHGVNIVTSLHPALGMSSRNCK